MSDTPRTDAAYFSKATLYDLAGEMKKLERKLTAANARIKTLEEQIESHSFALSPAMVQARNDQLNSENHRLLERIRGLEIQTLWDSAELRKQDAEIERLKSGGCARDQRATQFCAEALKLQEENARLQERIGRLEKSGDRLRKYLRIAVGPDAKGWETPHGVDIGKRIEAAIASWTKAKDAQ